MLTAEPSLIVKQMPRKKFKLAMSVGKNRHYATHDIMPRDFMQTADFAGNEGSVEDLASSAEPRLAEVLNTLPKGFPPLTDTVAEALERRARFLVDSDRAPDYGG